ERRIKCLLGNNVGYFGPFDHVLRSYTLRGHSISCQAGRLTLGIEANGDVKGCPSLPSATWVGGNVREHPVRDIWQRARALRVNRDRTVDALWGFCASCYYADECRGGCSWMASSLFGRTGNNPYCHHRALDFRARGLRERVVQRAPAPGTSFDHGSWEICVEPDAQRASCLTTAAASSLESVSDAGRSGGSRKKVTLLFDRWWSVPGTLSAEPRGAKAATRCESSKLQIRSFAPWRATTGACTRVHAVATGCASSW